MFVSGLARESFSKHPFRLRMVEVLVPAIIFLFFIPTIQEIFTSRAALLSFCFLAMGGVGLFCIRSFNSRFSKKIINQQYQSDHAPELTSWHCGWVDRLLYVVIFGGVVIFLKNVDVSWQHYSQAGVFIIAYSFCRFILSVFLLILCFTVGVLMLRQFSPNFQRDKIGVLSYFILCFFGGASIYAVVLTCLGLLGLLKFSVVLLLTVPILFFSPPFISQLAGTLYVKTYRERSQFKGLNWWIHSLLIWMVLVAGGFLFFSKGLYPGPIDNDVWEHYIPYYREVLRSGSTGPNELWSHFYLSKAAGLFYLLGLLSDCLAVQIVSWCFTLMAGIIVFQLLKEYTKDSFWALLGIIIFFAAHSYKDFGNFFKSHAVLAGCVAFLVWSSIQITRQAPLQRKTFYLFMTLASFYTGFYQPQGSSILVVFWGITACLVVFSRTMRFTAFLFATLSLFLIMGVITTVVLGYVFTGLATLDPVHTFWPLVNYEKFKQVFGTSGIAFSLFQEPHVQRRFSLDWALKIFRCEYFFSLFPPSLLLLGGMVGTLKFIKHRSCVRGWCYGYPILIFVTFIFSSFILTQLVITQSVLHLFMSTIFAMVVIAVILTKIVVDSFIPHSVKPGFCALLFIFLGMGAVTQELRYTGEVRLKALGAYMLGQKSFSDVIQETSIYFSQSLEAMTGARHLLGPNARIMDLSHDTGPGYSFPGAGVISEPSYLLGPDHLEMVFGAPARAKALLQKRGLNYFFIKLHKPLFSSLAFSRLFSPDYLNQYFKVIFHKGDNYLLTWRLPEDAEPIPQRLAQILELKQKGVLFYPSSTEFSDQMQSAALMPAQVAQFLQSGMVDRVVLKENQVFLRSLVSLIEQEHGPVTIDAVKEIIRRRCENQFGQELTVRLMNNDERIPYGYLYKSEEDFKVFLKEGK